MTDAYLKIVDRSLRSQGPSQARVADALRILSDWYQEAQHDYREQHASADLQIAGYVQGRTGARRTALSQAEMALTHATISRDQAETQWKAIAYQLQAQQAIVALLTK